MKNRKAINNKKIHCPYCPYCPLVLQLIYLQCIRTGHFEDTLRHFQKLICLIILTLSTLSSYCPFVTYYIIVSYEVSGHFRHFRHFNYILEVI